LRQVIGCKALSVLLLVAIQRQRVEHLIVTVVRLRNGALIFFANCLVDVIIVNLHALANLFRGLLLARVEHRERGVRVGGALTCFLLRRFTTHGWIRATASRNQVLSLEGRLGRLFGASSGDCCKLAELARVRLLHYFHDKRRWSHSVDTLTRHALSRHALTFHTLQVRNSGCLGDLRL